VSSALRLTAPFNPYQVPATACELLCERLTLRAATYLRIYVTPYVASTDIAFTYGISSRSHTDIGLFKRYEAEKAPLHSMFTTYAYSVQTVAPARNCPVSESAWSGLHACTSTDCHVLYTVVIFQCLTSVGQSHQDLSSVGAFPLTRFAR
jgi:hypothetical protein